MRIIDKQILSVMFILLFTTIFGFAQEQKDKKKKGIGSANPVSAQNSQEKQVDLLFSEINDKTPGAAVSIVKDGRVIYSKGFGLANLEYNIPITPKTKFNIASLSKQFTAFAVLLLAEKGKLSLDDDIRKYIPELPDYGKIITIRHMLTHTSGLRDYIQLLQMAGWKLSDVVTQKNVFDLIKTQKGLNFEPGEKFMYSNSGYQLLAEIVERVSGKSFAEFTRENIFLPLKMNDTLFYDDYEKAVINQAYSYYQNEQNYKKFGLTFSAVGGAGMLSTVEDLSRWAINFEKMKVGNKKLFAEMNKAAVLNNGETIHTSPGQFITPYKSLKQFQHAGGMMGFNAYLSHFPEQSFTVVVLSNSYEFSSQNKANQIADIYLNKYFDRNETQIRTPDEVKLSASELAKFSGHYWSEDAGLARRVFVREGNLIYSRSENNESILLPISKNEFVMSGAVLDIKFSFKTDKNNKKQMFYHLGNDPPIVFNEYVPVSYTTEELQEFEGRFYSEELDILYKFEIEKGKLVTNHLRAYKGSFKLIKPDLFAISDSMFSQIEFIRNEKKEIIGCRGSGTLAKGILFEKIMDKNP
jgi:CubicO group peptidase (beta-lactamase class C family)